MKQSAPPPAEDASVLAKQGPNSSQNPTQNETYRQVADVTMRTPEPAFPLTVRRPGQAPLTDAEMLTRKWKKHVGSARIVWSRITEEELLKSEGQVDTLTGLVQERYGITQEAAGKKVKNFLAQYKF